MYIKNPNALPKEHTYTCNGIIANWLIYEKHLPLLSREGRVFYFAKTDALDRALKSMPLWYKIAYIF